MQDKLTKLRYLVDNITDENALEDALSVLKTLRNCYKENKSLFKNSDILFLKSVKEFLSHESFSKKKSRLNLIKRLSNNRQRKRINNYININHIKKVDEIVMQGIKKRKAGSSTLKPLKLNSDFKQYINEGIAGSREDVKKAYRQIFSDIIKRNKE